MHSIKHGSREADVKPSSGCCLHFALYATRTTKRREYPYVFLLAFLL